MHNQQATDEEGKHTPHTTQNAHARARVSAKQRNAEERGREREKEKRKKITTTPKRVTAKMTEASTDHSQKRTTSLKKRTRKRKMPRKVCFA